MKGKYKIALGTVLILTLIPLPVVAELGDIVASFNTPPEGVRDLDWDGKYLWCYGTKMYKMDTSGNIVTTSDYPPIFIEKGLYQGVPNPLTYDGKYYYAIINNYTSNHHHISSNILEFYKLDTNGNILASSKHVEHRVKETASFKIFLSGLTYDGEYIRGIGRNPYNNYKLYKFDTDGNHISSFDTDVHFERDDAVSSLAWDGEYLWCTAPCERRIYKLDTNGNVITSIDAPDKHTTGLTCDGKYLWCAATSDGTDKIYKIDLGKAASPSKPTGGQPKRSLKTPEKETPGFEIMFAVVGLLAVAYLLRRER